MASITSTQGTRSAVTVSGLSTLGSGAYCVSDTIPLASMANLKLEVALATTNAVASKFQCSVFLQQSLDGTNFESGPTSGTSTTDEPDLTFVGIVPMFSSTTTHRKIFDLSDVIGDNTHSIRVVIKNEVGVALTSGTLHTTSVVGTIT